MESVARPTICGTGTKKLVLRHDEAKTVAGRLEDKNIRNPNLNILSAKFGFRRFRSRLLFGVGFAKTAALPGIPLWGLQQGIR
eukprot:1342989-Amorphochlora_amoeboformis.AAC.2